MNHCNCPTDAPRSRWITGRALVITRLSSVAMNIGIEAATIASHTGTRRTRPHPGGGAADPCSRRSESVVMTGPRIRVVSTGRRSCKHQMITYFED